MSKNKPKLPVNRINKWYSESEFDLDIQMGRESLEEDNNFIVVLFRVDRDNTQFHELYGETTSDGVRYKVPVELSVIPTIEEASNQSYNTNGTQRNLEGGNLSFGIFQQQLEEKGVEVSYGDYIGYAISETEMRYFTVVNDGLKNYDTKHTIMGYKSGFRSILCAPANKDEFNGM
jgi:hypothetical protein